MKLNYFKELDGVRGMAAIMVMFFHFFQGHPVGGNLLSSVIQKSSVFGQTGVTLFFVLSGFLITRILLETKENEHYFKFFYVRRSFRIFPLYYLFLIISYFLIPLIDNTPIPELGEQAYYWLYIQNIASTFRWDAAGPAHFWSLAVEEQFYLVWPLVVYFSRGRNLKVLIYGIIVAALLSRFLLITNGYGSFYFTLSNIDALALGALLSVMEREGQIEQIGQKGFTRLFVFSFIPLLVLWFFTGGQGLDIIQVLKLSMLALVYFALLGFVITSGRSALNKMFLTSPFQFSGKISYGLYVFHPVCFHYTAKLLPSVHFIFLMLFSFAASYLIASLSFYVFEKPILRYKRFFEYSPAKKPAKEIADKSLRMEQ